MQIKSCRNQEVVYFFQAQSMFFFSNSGAKNTIIFPFADIDAILVHMTLYLKFPQRLQFIMVSNHTRRIKKHKKS